MARGGTQVGHAVSESETLDQIIAHLTAMSPSSRADQRRLAEATDLAYALKRQATMGVHANDGAQQYRVSYRYLSPSSAGPFKGTMTVNADAKPSKGDTIRATFGIAEVTAVSAVRSTVMRNPVLALFGNPSKMKRAIECGEVLSHNVQAVLYVRDDDGEEYAHGYGLDDDNDLQLKTHRDGSVTIGGLKRETGFALVGLPSGEVVICDAAEVDE